MDYITWEEDRTVEGVIQTYLEKKLIQNKKYFKEEGYNKEKDQFIEESKIKK